MSNHPQVLAAVPAEDRESELPLHIDGDESVKTIELLWQPNSDTFGVRIVVQDLSLAATKRRVLSSIARIFNPLGWLSAVSIRPKTLMQEIWKCKLDWDAPFLDQLNHQWQIYYHELKILEDFRISRCVTCPPSPSGQLLKYELHGFSDASKSAYSAVVYIRAVNPVGPNSVTVVAAKSKVAPVKTETIPRLELCGAVLLAQLMRSVQEFSMMEFSVTRCWTDSTIVLNWIASTKRLPVFESNRVRKIESCFPTQHWNHVDGVHNPADSASRGISAQSVLSHLFWLHGPPRLATTDFPTEPLSLVVTKDKGNPILNFIHKSSSFNQMKNVVGHMLLFVHNTRFLKAGRTGPLTLKELDSSLLKIVSLAQEKAFHEDLLRSRRRELPKSPLKFLCPFLDKDGILRVGCRLDRSSLPYTQKHPILLPRRHHFTDAVVDYYHRQLLHAAPQLLYLSIREQFWIIRGADVVRHAVRRCIICHRQTANDPHKSWVNSPQQRQIHQDHSPSAEWTTLVHFISP